MLFFFPRGVLGEILNLIESVSGGFPSYFSNAVYCINAAIKRQFSFFRMIPNINISLVKFGFKMDFSFLKQS